jgi:crossover junction endodeoxyribonuclease RuvC
MTKDKIILGIDPGTNLMGYGVIEDTHGKLSLIAMGIVDLKKLNDPYLKLNQIYERITGLIDSYHPDELAIESQFFGKNVQSMLKLGRAQGVAIVAALQRSIPIFEYAPRKIKLSITGTGTASKEQVALLLQRMLNIKELPEDYDATDAVAIAVCHAFQSNVPQLDKANSWKDFVAKNPKRIKG